METDQSYGVIPYRVTETGRREFLLVQHLAGHWGFAKGHLDPGETPIDAARRELSEETGLDGAGLEILGEAGAERTFEEQYVFTKRSKRRVRKRVSYFVGRMPLAQAGRELRPEPDEVVDAAWGDARTTRNRLTFGEGKALLDEVVAYLDSRNE